MYLKWNITGFISFIVLGAVIYVWGPGFGSAWRIGATVALYAVLFFASFVVVSRH